MNATKGELTITDADDRFQQVFDRSEVFEIGSDEHAVGVAVVPANRTNARLLAAAWNSYQRLAAITGADPVDLAERDVLGMLWEACEKICQHFNGPNAAETMADAMFQIADYALAACRKPEDEK